MDQTKQILQRVEECLGLARKHYGIELPWIDVRFDLSGDTAGFYCSRGDKKWFRFNRGLIEHHLEDFLVDTVPHEVSHYVTRTIWGRKVKSHGKEWKSVMRDVFKLEPTRCHSLDTSALKVTYEYTCGCPGHVHKLSKRQHLKAQRYLSTYCRRCKAHVSFRAEVGPSKNPLPIVEKLFVSTGGRALSTDDLNRVRKIISTCEVKSVVADSVMSHRDCEVLARQLGWARNLIERHDRPNTLPSNVSHAVLFEKHGCDRHMRMAKAYEARGVIVRVIKEAVTKIAS